MGNVGLGGFWAYYSLWFLQASSERKAIVLEPEPNHMVVGQANAALNGLQPKFVSGFAGAKFALDIEFQSEVSGKITSTCYSVSHLMSEEAWEYVDLLHCDTQGHEVTVLESCRPLFAAGKIGWMFVSTHAHQICGDPLTHQKCLHILQQSGAKIVAEHDVHESFSGDGLIVACFGNLPKDWQNLELSHNRHGSSLFRSLAYDLDEVSIALAALDQEVKNFGGMPDTVNANFSKSGLLFTLNRESPLGPAGPTILIPDDKIMSPAIISDACWDYDNVSLFAKHLKRDKQYTLIDIGANIGMFSRQIKMVSNQIDRALCIEPDDRNFNALKFNMAPFIDRVELFNVALGSENSVVEFYRDTHNIGNYSMNKDAMRARAFDRVRVTQHETREWMLSHLGTAESLAWKSDTQGFGEVIISRTPMEIWQQIDVALVQIWRIEKPYFDMDALRERFSSFPNRKLGAGESVSVDEIVAYLSGSDWQFKDLLMWR